MNALTLVVDAANVIGSVPDGWWRNRAGAAQRLHAHLLSDTGPRHDYAAIVLVLEGKARSGVSAGTTGNLTTVHAPASGDDEIVHQCQRLTNDGHQVTLATADRGLINRVRPLGVRITGPRSVRR